VDLALSVRDGAVVLSVRDDGRGITRREAAARRMGLGGMHERALLVGGPLTVRCREDGGTEVRLAVPVKESG
jgi:two-component system, NarL family, sensor histidine kinase UhpB